MDCSKPIRAPQGQTQVKSIRIHSYVKCARKPFRITLFQNKELKVPANHTVAKKGVGGVLSVARPRGVGGGDTNLTGQRASCVPDGPSGANGTFRTRPTQLLIIPSLFVSTHYELPCVPAKSCPVFSVDYALLGEGGRYQRRKASAWRLPDSPHAAANHPMSILFNALRTPARCPKLISCVFSRLRTPGGRGGIPTLESRRIALSGPATRRGSTFHVQPTRANCAFLPPVGPLFM